MLCAWCKLGPLNRLAVFEIIHRLHAIHPLATLNPLNHKVLRRLRLAWHTVSYLNAAIIPLYHIHPLMSTTISTHLILISLIAL
jgi:hypothetical protein